MGVLDTSIPRGTGTGRHPLMQHALRTPRGSRLAPAPPRAAAAGGAAGGLSDDSSRSPARIIETPPQQYVPVRAVRTASRWCSSARRSVSNTVGMATWWSNT